MVVREDEDLEAGEHRHVVRDLGELVGAKVELHNVEPSPDVYGKRRQLVLLHVQFLKVVCSRENAIGYSAKRRGL